MDIQTITVVASVAVTGVGVLTGLTRFALAQFERRIGEKFSAFEKSLVDKNEQVLELKRQIESHQHALPREYVRREDWIRFSTVIDAKLDRLGERLSDLMRANLRT